jgi:tripartite-type tricarboxylate transporter receptor subunit TctC
MRLALVAAIFMAANALAQSEYPARPVRIVVPSPPGGGTDIVARVLAQHYSKALAQPFFVENKPGAGNIIGIESVARAPADGYTLLVVASTLALNSVLYRKVPYDPLRDFAPITLAATAPNVLIVHREIPAQTLADFITLARGKPGALSYGTPGIGTSPHLSMELLKSMAGIDLQHVPYRGTAAAVTDVISGQIAATFANALTAKPQVDAGRVRALAVSGPRRIDALPAVPPVADAGVPGYEAMQWYGMVAPAGTPPAIIARLHAEAVKALQSEDRSELDKWTRVARDARIAPQ